MGVCRWAMDRHKVGQDHAFRLEPGGMQQLKPKRIRTVWKGTTLPTNRTSALSHRTPKSPLQAGHVRVCAWRERKQNPRPSPTRKRNGRPERDQVQYADLFKWPRSGWGRICRHSSRSLSPTVWETGAPSLDVAILRSHVNWGRCGATWGASLARSSRERAGVDRARFWSIKSLRGCWRFAPPVRGRLYLALSRTVGDGRRCRHTMGLFLVGNRTLAPYYTDRSRFFAPGTWRSYISPTKYKVV